MKRLNSIYSMTIFFALLGLASTSCLQPANAHGSQLVSSVDKQEWIGEQVGQGLDAKDEIASQVVANEFHRQISNVEWLAPLAPVALSPFFGITLLSGLACYGPDWLPDNALLSDGSPLSNPVMFWAFLVLTILTSAPRFSKVSKPIAQVADFLETYSAIVILLVLKFISMQSEPVETVAVQLGHQAGIVSSSWEGLLMIAMAINVVVVNSVKFFFEMLVWITPIPMLDACFEIANKSLCAMLMAIYALHPVVALVVNILIFVACAVVFNWMRRREVFFREMIWGWGIQFFRKSPPKLTDQLVVFPSDSIGAIPSRSKCFLSYHDCSWQLTTHRMLRGPLTETVVGTCKLHPGWWTNSIITTDGRKLTFSSKYNQKMDELSQQFGFMLVDETDLVGSNNRQVEFA